MLDKRAFGQNMKVYMHVKGLSEEDMAKALGYTALEIKQIIDSRLFITTQEKTEIANFLEVPLSAFSQQCKDAQLSESGYMECVGEFSCAENRNRILDMFDAYCDIQELLARDGE